MSGINLIQDEGCKKPTSTPPPLSTRFFAVTSTNVGIIPPKLSYF